MPPEIIERQIFLIRGVKVIIDTELARLYQVETRALIQAVKRNKARFPSDFCFQLNSEESKILKSQSVISNIGRGGRRYAPYAFTEHGVAMLSSVLKSARAVEMNISIIRAFIKLREMLATHKELAEKIEKLEYEQKEQSNRLKSVYSIVRQLIETPVKSVGKIGFDVKK